MFCRRVTQLSFLCWTRGLFCSKTKCMPQCAIKNAIFFSVSLRVGGFSVCKKYVVSSSLWVR